MPAPLYFVASASFQFVAWLTKSKGEILAFLYGVSSALLGVGVYHFIMGF